MNEHFPTNEELLHFPNLQYEKFKYYRRARELAEKGEDFFETLQLSARCELLHFVQTGIKHVIICGCSEIHKGCARMNGKKMTVLQALKKLPIPKRNCGNHLFHESGKGFCVGSYEYDTNTEYESLT